MTVLEQCVSCVGIFDVDSDLMVFFSNSQTIIRLQLAALGLSPLSLPFHLNLSFVSAWQRQKQLFLCMHTTDPVQYVREHSSFHF